MGKSSKIAVATENQQLLPHHPPWCARNGTCGSTASHGPHDGGWQGSKSGRSVEFSNQTGDLMRKFYEFLTIPTSILSQAGLDSMGSVQTRIYLQTIDRDDFWMMQEILMDISGIMSMHPRKSITPGVPPKLASEDYQPHTKSRIMLYAAVRISS